MLSPGAWSWGSSPGRDEVGVSYLRRGLQEVSLGLFARGVPGHLYERA